MLTTVKPGVYKCQTYTEQDYQQFPSVDIAELKQKVKEQCGEEWYKPQEYPCTVSISRYLLRIKGRDKATGQQVTKIIVIEKPMGC